MNIFLYNVDTRQIEATYVSSIAPRVGEFVRLGDDPYKIVDVEHSIPHTSTRGSRTQDKVTLLAKKV